MNSSEYQGQLFPPLIRITNEMDRVNLQETCGVVIGCNEPE